MATEETNKSKKTFSRRKFFTRAGIGLVGTAALLYFGRSPIRRKISGVAADLDLPSGVLNFDTDMWFEINADNTVTLKSPKVEMGQGIFTGFAMLAAEELDVAFDKIKVVHATTANGAADLAGTGGSSSTSSLYKNIREVAATLRETLKLNAAKIWNIDPSVIQTKEGVLSANDKTITYAELAKQTTDWKTAKTPALRAESQFKYVGTEQKRVDLLDKVSGKPIYGIDVDLPNMVYGAVLYCPYIGGSLKKADIAAAKNAPNVLKVVEHKDWIGVVANTRYAAQKAAEQINVEWNIPKKYTTQDIVNTITVGNGTKVNVQNVGDTEGVVQTASTQDAAVVLPQGRVLVSNYRTSLGVHAAIEPSVTVADVTADKIVIHAPIQLADKMQADVAKALDVSKKNVEIKPTFIGGGFGRRMQKHNAAEAALLSKAVGKPVHLLCNRQQEFQSGYLRPNTHHVLRGLTNGGKVQTLTHDMATADMVLWSFSSLADDVLGADFISAGHGARIPYAVPNQQATMWQSELPFTTGIWRGVGMFANTFAIECFMDELSEGKDALQFRIDHCDDSELLTRRRTVLTKLKEKSGWNTPKAADIGRGVAVGEDRKSISAAVVEVKIEGGFIRVVKVTQIIDAGKIVNPNGVRQQVEGATVMAMSAALYEEVHIEDSQIVEANFNTYRVARLSDSPQIEVIIHEGSPKPYGVGEAPMSPIAPAIANAVFNLTGKRLRSLPLQTAFEN
ncbi:MAG: molybdopterin cofactor-binding domain-containing protein [Saprospiraceae bacterium]|nr:molybdopterin cofactor-binding domain-containing protein [Saprospiraceae bacterium]